MYEGLNPQPQSDIKVRRHGLKEKAQNPNVKHTWPVIHMI